MAQYVVDASVVTSYLINDQYTANAQALFRQSSSADRLIVPEFYLLECTNVLWKHVRFYGLPQSQAEQLIVDLRRLSLTRIPVKRLLSSALQIGLTHQLAVYDSVYIVLAQRMKLPIITVDQKQLQAATMENVTVVSITQFQP